MTLAIELKPDVEKRLMEIATSEGVDATELARRLIEEHLPDAKGTGLAQLMESWIEEDATDDPAELEARDREWEELRANLNANRAAAGARLLFP